MVQGMGDEVLVEQAGGARTRTRRCVAARAPRPADGMIRFVLGPDAALVPDLAARLPGRGMWVSADRKALTQPWRTGCGPGLPGPRWARRPIW